MDAVQICGAHMLSICGTKDNSNVVDFLLCLQARLEYTHQILKRLQDVFDRTFQIIWCLQQTHKIIIPFVSKVRVFVQQDIAFAVI